MKSRLLAIALLFSGALSAQSDSLGSAPYRSHWGTYRGWGFTAGFSFHRSPVFEFGMARFIENRSTCAFGYSHLTQSVMAAYNPEHNTGSIHVTQWANSGMLLSFGIDAGYYTNFCCRQAGSLMPMAGLGISGVFIGYGYNLLIPSRHFEDISGSSLVIRCIIKLKNEQASPFPPYKE
ncbi:MAG: hypothetical protein AB1458_15330 [Bacteroidota bacterium]